MLNENDTDSNDIDILLRDTDGHREECGVFGVWAPGRDVAEVVYYGLNALQHRGQEAAGIASSDGNSIRVFKDAGLVGQIFTPNALASLTGDLAIGHTRYSTAGGSTWKDAQPTLSGDDEITVALAHNGNLNEVESLRNRAENSRSWMKLSESGHNSDTALLTSLLVSESGSLEERALRLLPTIHGAFCLVFMDEHTLYAARDPQGFRPLFLGRLPQGWVVASETPALDIVGATLVREVEPGELIAIDSNGLRSTCFEKLSEDSNNAGSSGSSEIAESSESAGSSKRVQKSSRRECLFEHVYLARPDGLLRDRSVYATRVAMGRRLAVEHPAIADIVIATPESGVPAAMGFAQESGLPYTQGLVKNAYVGRTFISPSQEMRQRGIRLKLNPVREAVAGKRVVVVDDSIVRGNTQRAVVSLLREAGATEVHVRISSSPVEHPCHWGIDFPTRGELIAPSLTPEDIAHSLGADSLGYLSIDGMIEATTFSDASFCTSCFTGKNPLA